MATYKQPTAERLQEYAADPMAYFADATIPGVNGDVVLGDVWAPFQVEAFEAMARCCLAVAAGEKPPYRGLWLERTKGASKDSDVGLALTWLLLFSRRPLSCELAADDFGQIMETHKAMRTDLRLNAWKAERLTLRKDRIINESTGSECLFLTRDETGSHGSRPNGCVVCNELAHCQSETFISTMLDNADKLARNFIIIATNAGELTTWQHRWREMYRQNPRWYFQAVHEPAPWIDPQNVKDAEQRNSPGRFRRLWKGTWVPPGGDALATQSISRAIKHDSPMLYREDGYHGTGIGVDIGLTNHHTSIVVVVSHYETQRVRVAYVRDFPPPVSLESVYQGILNAADQFGAKFLAYDPYEMARISQELEAVGFTIEPCRPTPKVLTLQAATLREVFREGTIELYDDAEGGDGHLLIDDLYQTRVVEKGYGERLEWPENENGHCDRAAALANVLPFAIQALAIPPATCGVETIIGHIT